MKIWRHLPPALRDEAAEWVDPTRLDHLIGDCSTPPPECVAEAPSLTPDPVSKGRPWREDYEEAIRVNQAEVEKKEEAHLAYLNDFLQQHGRLPTLQEDKFSKGLEMFTNRLIPALQRGQKRRRALDYNDNDSEDDSEVDDGEVDDSDLDPEYEDY